MRKQLLLVLIFYPAIRTAALSTSCVRVEVVDIFYFLHSTVSKFDKKINFCWGTTVFQCCVHEDKKDQVRSSIRAKGIMGLTVLTTRTRHDMDFIVVL